MIHQTGINQRKGIRLSDEILTQVQPMSTTMNSSNESSVNAISCRLIIKLI